MKRLRSRLRSFFFPPESTPLWLRILPYGLLGALTLVVLTAGVYGWEYTNSPQFCGTACHTMPPEFTAYLTSPHARVDCVECHIGRGFIATRITRKAGDAQHIISLAFSDYEFPIRAKKLQPARETCERCHSPEKFSDDSLREVRRFGNDPNNTPTSIYLVMKTGGGSARQGLGRGIHWHIENPVLFFASDELQQDIPYVQVINPDGSVDSYLDIEADFDPAAVNPEELREMDCITCHNRITHLILTPEDTLDQLLTRGEISDAIPEIRRKGVEVYSARYDTLALGLNGIAGLEGYYQTYYPDFYAANEALVSEAIQALQNAYSISVFPEQSADWTSHADNVGHQDSPGCFRCHDGKHLTEQGEAIRLECNVCHAIPVVAGPGDFVTDIEISRGPEPENHLNSNWITLHREVFDQTCQNCHTTENAGSSDNTSFCSNTACHGNVYEYAGFDAPALRAALVEQLPPTPMPVAVASDKINYTDAIGPLLQQRCGTCHGEGGMLGLDLTTYETTIRGGQNGTVIFPGDPEASKLVQKQSLDQPHFGQFTDEELKLVIEWIQLGVPEN